MDKTQSTLIKGAVKSAISSACGLVMGLPVSDPEHFGITSLAGIRHLGLTILVVVVVGEARFFKQWIDAWKTDESLAPGD